MRLKSITLQGFRGFNIKQSISLNNDVILFYGGNGTGKSSLVEALEWMFYNELSRKTRSLCRSEYTVDAIKNIHYDEKEGNPFVELEIMKDDKNIILKKELISAMQCKYFIDGAEVSDFSSLGVSFDNIHKPILGQSEIKRFVDTEQKDRWEEISKILGLEDISIIRENLLSLRKDVENDSKFKELSKLKDSIEYDLNQISLNEFMVLINEKPFNKSNFSNNLLLLLKKLYSDKGQDISSYTKFLEDKLNIILQISSTTEKLKKLNYEEDKNLDKGIIELTANSIKLIEDLNILKDFKFAEIEFLKKGLELIKEDFCPFCNEKTISKEKKRKLNDELENQKEKLDKYDSYKKLKDQLSKHKKELLEKIKRTLINPVELALIIEDIIKYPAYKELIPKMAEFSKDIKVFFDKIETFSMTFDGFIELLDGLQKEENEIRKGQEFTNSMGETLNKIISESIKEGLILNKIKDELIQKTSGLSEEDKLSLNKIQSILKIINNQNKLIMLGIYRNNISNLTDLITHIERFEKDKSTSLLKQLSTAIQKYYNELNPDENITFEEIVPSEGSSRKAKIKGNSYGKEINPVSCFSEAHTNCLGLSLYFPQRVDNNPDWKFILLDDPVQSMDIDHSKNLIRILMRISNNKQVIVLTHSHSFKQDFEDLFYGKNYWVYDFSAYSKDGPKLILIKADIDVWLDAAENLAKGNSTERHTAGANIRKALEIFMANFLIHKNNMAVKKVTDMKLEDKLVKFEEVKVCRIEEIAEIKTMLNVVDPASHGRPTRDISTKEIIDGIILIKKLKKDYL